MSPPEVYFSGKNSFSYSLKFEGFNKNTSTVLKFTNKLEHLEIKHEREKGFVSVVAGNSRVNGTTRVETR